MGMQPGSDGSLRPHPGFLTRKIPDCEELQRPNMPLCVVEEYDPLLDSSDMGPEDWIKIAETVSDNFLDFDGFVIIHGTDTMAYTASALSFMFSNLSKPVVLVGSMLPFGEVQSDARRNLACAILIAGTFGDILPEVCIFFNDVLIRGNRATKIHSSAFAAFDSPNCPALLTMGTQAVPNRSVILHNPKGRFALSTALETRILVIHLVPGFVDLESITNSDVKGVILLLYGTGNAPSRRDPFVNWVKKLVDNNVVVVACSQCLQGRVEFDQYAVGKRLQDAGVISAVDMTCEAAVTKMAYLLPMGLSQSDFNTAFQTSLRGELTEHDGSLQYIRNIDQMSRL
jgi:L-asparaginase